MYRIALVIAGLLGFGAGLGWFPGQAATLSGIACLLIAL